MFDEVNRALDEYFGKWRGLIAARKDERNKEFFDRMKPTTVGWKVADFDEYHRLLEEWRSACDTVTQAWINERWIAVLHLKDVSLSGGIELVEVLQRRPGSDDKTGLDFVDFLCMEETNTKAILEEENDIQWFEGKNGISEWLSLHFDGAEAKLRMHTVLDIVREELRLTSNKIRGEKFAVYDSAPAGGIPAEIE